MADTGVLVVAVYAIVLFLPGLLLGRLAGMRGWTSVAAAPLLTYAVAGMAGPLMAAIGIGWSPASAGVLVVGLAAAAMALRLVLGRWRGAATADDEPIWPRRVQFAVAGSVGVIGGLGAAVIWAGVGDLSAIPQDWDAAFHANGIRWIVETGDASLVGMGQVNWYEDGVEIFYPNAYHLVAALVMPMAGADVPTVLNAQTVLLPGIGALTVVALVHRFRGRPGLAVAAAACSVSFTAFYDMLWRGPLLPFVTGAVLMPLAAVLLLDLLDARTWWSRVGNGLLFDVGLVGLICLNPAMLFTAAVFVLPAMMQRWAGRPRLLLGEPFVIACAGLGAAVLALPQILGSIGSADGEPVFDWPAELSQSEAVGELLTMSHDGLTPQWWLMIAVVLGLARYPALRCLRWIGIAGAAFAVMFVLAASSDAAWVNAITRPWWNDRWRLIGLCVVPIAVLGGHGLAELQRLAAMATVHALRRPGEGTSVATRRTATVLTTGLVLALFVVGSNGLYFERNVARMRLSAPDGPVVSSLEVDAMHALAAMVPPGERVLNGRGDGSAWMYAIAGVLPIAGHYDMNRTGPDARLLSERFNRYPDDPQVRAAVKRLRISHVMLGRGFVRSDWQRAPGLTGLADADWLDTVYRNRDAVIYRIRTGVPDRP